MMMSRSREMTPMETELVGLEKPIQNL